MDEQTLWVGRRNSGGDNDVFVYDPEMQDSSSSRMFLFSLRLNAMQQLQKDGLRKYFSKVIDKELNKTSKQMYLDWKTVHGNEFTKIHPVTEEQKIQVVAEKHKDYLSRIRRKY